MSKRKNQGQEPTADADDRAMRVLEEERPVPPANHEEQVARARERHAKILERHEGDALHPARALIEKNRARREGGE